jgi:hypothetical protein
MDTLALVIGNEEYTSPNELNNAVYDATEMANVFKRLDFDVIEKYNIKANENAQVLENFESQVESYDATIFYFAGHGFEVDGDNYLAATDCQLTGKGKYHFDRNSIRLNEILYIFKKYPNKINIIIIDACRKSFSRSSNVGFSPVQAPKGTFLAFSTSPNEGAIDGGFKGHSVYTGALLEYIGREGVFVEELFKKVRKTVHNLTDGKQTTWEHTSLIGDYYFNSGQLVHSLEIPYSEDVVKDVNYNGSGEFGKIIEKIKSGNWHKQNPAINQVLNSSKELNKNQQFILGRNILQASAAANAAKIFMNDLSTNVYKYNEDGVNHLLNGILFEIYFDSRGQFRHQKTKKHYFEKVISLRKDSNFENSFESIRKLLAEQQYSLIYIPKKEDEKCDVDIVASKETRKSHSGNNEDYEVISKIVYKSIDITEDLGRYDVYRETKDELKTTLANFLTAPKDLVHINSNIELTLCEIPDPQFDNIF